MKYLSFFTLIFFHIGCGAMSVNPLSKESESSLPPGVLPLNKENVQKVIRKSLAEGFQSSLIREEKQGCETLPLTDAEKAIGIPVKFSGKRCSIKVEAGNKISYAFPSRSGSVVAALMPQTDIYVGELGGGEVFIAQDHLGERKISDITITTYDSKGNVNYGINGEGSEIRGCHLNESLIGSRC